MQGLNEAIYQILTQFEHRSFLLDDLVAFIAQYVVYFMLLGLVPFFVGQKSSKERWMLFFELALAIIVSRGIITEAFHFHIESPRPFVVKGFEPLIGESGNSFPSGHMASIWPVVMILFYRSKGWAFVYAFLGIVIGFARIYVGVHWPFDILSGIVIGMLSGWFIHRVVISSIKKYSNSSTTGDPVAD